jgi:hypothetical protein
MKPGPVPSDCHRISEVFSISVMAESPENVAPAREVGADCVMKNEDARGFFDQNGGMTVAMMPLDYRDLGDQTGASYCFSYT